MKKEKRGYNVKTEVLKFVVIAAVFLLIIIAVYYSFFYSVTCLNQECFMRNLVSCKRASWINEAESASWAYNIKGKQTGQCEIEVKLLVIKKGAIDMGGIEGKSMNCYLPVGLIASPEQNLEDCKGKLKEELQNLIIKRMHSYILENLGEISEELIKPL